VRRAFSARSLPCRWPPVRTGTLCPSWGSIPQKSLWRGCSQRPNAFGRQHVRLVQLSLVTVLALVGSCTAVPQGQERKQESSAPGDFFERLDTNGDGKVTLDEAPRQGKMLVEFLLSQSGKKSSDPLTRQEFLRLNSSHAYDHAPTEPCENAVAAALSAGEVQPAPENCPACAMGLTADFVFKRLDVDGDRFVTVTEFMRSPGMQDETKSREAVGRLDKNGDGRLSFEELEAAYKARHANCKKPPAATIAANPRPDGRGDGNRFAQVFILRSDRDGDGRIGKNDQAPMTNETETETQTKKQCPTGDAPWDIGHCCLIGHWCLVIGALGNQGRFPISPAVCRGKGIHVGYRLAGAGCSTNSRMAAISDSRAGVGFDSTGSRWRTSRNTRSRSPTS